MTLTSVLLHHDDSLTALDVRCTCSAGQHDEEVTAELEVVIPLTGALMRRAHGGSSLVDAAFGYVAPAAATQEITHLSDGDRCVAVAPAEVLVDELGLDADAASWTVPVDRALQRHLSRAMTTAPEGDQLAAGEAWLRVVSGLGVRSASGERRGGAAQREAAVARVREAIVAAPGAPWTVRALGAVGGYAPHHLSRVFKAATGMSLSGYRDRVRLGRALALLRDGMAIGEVAVDLGYYDHAHLTRRVTQLLGVRPSALRSSRRPDDAQPT